MLLTSRKFLTFYLNFYKLNPVLRYLNKHDCSPWPSAATLANLTSNMLNFPVRYAQNQPKVYPPYNLKCSNHALRVKSNLEAKHTISAHRSLSKFQHRLANYRKFILTKLWKTPTDKPRHRQQYAKTAQKSLKGCRLELEFWPLNIRRRTNLACVLVIFRLVGLTACVACLLTSPIEPTMWNSGSNPGKA